MSNPIDSFAELATSYCTLIDKHGDYSAEELITRVRDFLPLLYYRALQLPQVESVDEEPDQAISHDEWSALFNSLKQKLGVNDHYWAIYAPIKLEHDIPIAASLSDDLADIWRDLKDGASRWTEASEGIRDQIVWSWHFSFHYHWSDHAVDALRAIHWLSEHYGIREN